MVSNHAVSEWEAPVKASVSAFHSFSSLFFSLPSSPFSLETPDTQARALAAAAAADTQQEVNVTAKSQLIQGTTALQRATTLVSL